MNRSTRSVAPTEAGERLLRAVGPRCAGIEVEVFADTGLADTVTGRFDAGLAWAGRSSGT